jgi:hypothetical protein
VSAVEWYLHHAPEQVDRLLDEFESGLQGVARVNVVLASPDGRCRRLPLRRFPYQLWYVVDEDAEIATVIALVHDRQDDRGFTERI